MATETAEITLDVNEHRAAIDGRRRADADSRRIAEAEAVRRALETARGHDANRRRTAARAPA